MKKVDIVCSVTQLCLTLCTPCTVAHQASLSMGFPRQEYCSGLSFPSPGDLPDPGIEPLSPALQVDSLPAEPPEEAQEYWSGQPVPSPADLPYPGIKPRSPSLQVDSLPAEPPG